MTTLPLTPVAPTFRSALVERIQRSSGRLGHAAAHLLAASGKGVRPMCVRLIGQAVHANGRVGENHEQFAEAIELLHVGSLIHDDILDEAASRRGVPSVHVSWDAKVAVLAGDYLLAEASRLVANLDDPYMSRRMSEVISDLCEGELLQDEQLRDLNVTIDAYLERIAKKTASPFELAAEGGARLSGASPRMAAVARRLGFHLGRLFQVVDDLLDWTASEKDLGKPVGRDLAAGCLTLPVLVALQHPQVGSELRRLLTPFPEEIPQAARDLIASPEILAETAELVAQEGERVRQWLLELPAGSAREQMETMLNGLLTQGGVGAA